MSVSTGCFQAHFRGETSTTFTYFEQCTRRAMNIICSDSVVVLVVCSDQVIIVPILFNSLRHQINLGRDHTQHNTPWKRPEHTTPCASAGR